MRRVTRSIFLRFDVALDGTIDRHRIFVGPCTLGGIGTIDEHASIAGFSRGSVDQFIALTGHANDGPDGKPLAPTMDLPF